MLCKSFKQYVVPQPHPELKTQRFRQQPYQCYKMSRSAVCIPWRLQIHGLRRTSANMWIKWSNAGMLVILNGFVRIKINMMKIITFVSFGWGSPDLETFSFKMVILKGGEVGWRHKKSIGLSPSREFPTWVTREQVWSAKPGTIFP